MLSEIKFPLVIIYCDGNKEIGFGHIRRTTSLAENLRKYGIPVVISGLSEYSISYLPRVEFSTSKLKVVVFDSMIGVGDLILSFQNKGIITVTLDWFGNIVPDINIIVFPHFEPKALLKSYVGFKNIIIRDEILNLPKIPIADVFKNVVITLGGGDILHQSEIAAEILNSKGYNVTVIKGPLAEVKVESLKYRTLINPTNFPDILNSCDWVITNGGGCLFEALYLGKPTFVLPQTELESRIALYARQSNYIVGIGMENLIKLDSHKFKSVSEKSIKLVDGKGLSRIVSIIKQLV
jgi:UDP-2,4-diacetamido-2,4,6-trideoxy-beta-L-altropyranose hydrolase